MLYLSLVFSYQIMAQCWQENPNDRPTFPSLKDIITRMSKNKNVSEKLRFSMPEVVNYWVALLFKCICFESLCMFLLRYLRIYTKEIHVAYGSHEIWAIIQKEINSSHISRLWPSPYLISPVKVLYLNCAGLIFFSKTGDLLHLLL